MEIIAKEYPTREEDKKMKEEYQLFQKSLLILVLYQ